MSVQKAKAAVTAYFSGRKAALQLLNGKRVRAGSDFFELYVLVRLARRANATVPKNTPFIVAGSPSPSWSDASHIDIKGLGARTGLQVQCAQGSVELDVVLVDKKAIDSATDRVPAKAATAAFECKALSGKIKTTHANEAIGKAYRVWTLPVPSITRGGNIANRYATVGINGSSSGLDKVLAPIGIGLAEDLNALEAHLVQLLRVLI